MNVKNFFSTVPKFKGLAATVGGFALRYKKLTVAAVAAALLFGPLLLTGDGELFVLNALGIGIAVLLVRRFTARRSGRRSRH